MFYEGETWSLALMRKRRLRFLENREMRGPALAEKYYVYLCLLETTQDCPPKSLILIKDRKILSFKGKNCAFYVLPPLCIQFHLNTLNDTQTHPLGFIWTRDRSV